MIFDRQAKRALIVAIATLAACGIGFRYVVHAANAYLNKQPVELRQPLTTIPKKLGPWEAVDPDRKMTAELEEELGTTQYIDRWYFREGANPYEGGALGVHITYYTGLIDTVPHIPDRCMVAHGWLRNSRPANLDLDLDQDAWKADPDHVNMRRGEPYPLCMFRHRVTGQPVTVRMPLGDFQLRTTQFRTTEDPDAMVYAGYLFIANGETTPSGDKVRTFAFDLTTKYAYYAKIQFTMHTDAEAAQDEFTGQVSSLLEELLPELMRCLPDWSEVEAIAPQERPV